MSDWSFEDGGPRRRQTTTGELGLATVGHGGSLAVTTRFAPATTMAVWGGDRLYLLGHTAGDGAVSWVEEIDPLTLEPLARSADLPGGPVWPGGVGVHDDGTLTVVFGNHAHRLDADDLSVRASTSLPRHRPYNSFVPLPDGHIVTKDFGGSLPGRPVRAEEREPTELVVLDADLAVVAQLQMPEPSIARLSADGDTVYVVGDTSLLRARWDGRRLVLDDRFVARYRVEDGQTYGWDCVLAGGAAWFLDDGDGSDGFDGTLRGHGRSTAPLHLVRVDLTTAEVTMAEVCGRPGGLVANPPLVDEERGVVVAYDSGNGVIVGLDLGTLEQRWRRDQDHASHLLLYAGSGELVTGDHADVVVLDVVSGTELARVDGGMGMQSVLFPTPGRDRDFYVCTFLGISRVAVTSS